MAHLSDFGIALDMSIQLKAASGTTGKLSVSLKNVHWARRPLIAGKEAMIDVSRAAATTNGIELQDREFFAAIGGGRKSNASVDQVLP